MAMRANLNVAVLATCQALLNTMGSMLAAISALVGMALASNTGLATLPVALTVIGTAAGTIPASMLMKWLGRRAGFLLGAAIGLAGALLAGHAVVIASFYTFCAATFLLGVFTAFGNYYRFAAADAAPEHLRGRAISYVLAGGVVAGFIGPTLAKTTRNGVGDTEFLGCFFAIAGLAVLTAMMVSLIRMQKSAPASATSPERRLGTIARQRTFICAVVGAAAGTAVMILVMSATPLAVVGHDHGFDDSATVIQWHVVAMFAPSFVTGRLLGHYGTRPVMLMGTTMLFVASIIAMVGTTMPHFVAALTCLGVGWNFLFVAGSSLLTTTHNTAERGKTQALNDFVIYSVSAVASLSAGTALQHLGWTGVNAIALIAVALTAVVLWRLGPIHAGARD